MGNIGHKALILGGILAAASALAQSSRSPQASRSRGLLELQTHLLPPLPGVQLPASDLYPVLASKNILEREELAVALFERGHFPHRLRDLKPVTIQERGHEVTFWVMPDYLSLGSDKDNILMPLNFNNTLRLANSWGFVLPTRKMVDAIYDQATRTIWPKTFPPGPEMSSMERIKAHSDWIKGQRYLSPRQNVLTAGHKKDIVMSKRLYGREDRIAIYGWQNIRSGEPIQPLSIWHGDRYVDYSHGIRLVASWVVVDGSLMPLKQMLLDRRLAHLLSDEGTLDADRVLRNFPQSYARNL